MLAGDALADWYMMELAVVTANAGGAGLAGSAGGGGGSTGIVSAFCSRAPGVCASIGSATERFVDRGRRLLDRLRDQTGAIGQGPAANLFGSNAKQLSTQVKGSYVDRAGGPVSRFMTEMQGGMQGARNFFTTQTGLTAGSRATSTIVDGVRYTFYPVSTSTGQPTVSVFNAVTATLEKIRFWP
ncbi:MAG: hypothetical protein GY788_27245 [bacterium]|nr:hypothetical protein [bacterium]